MSEPKHITVLGAGGVTGRKVVDQALADGHRVRAVELSQPFGMPDDERLECVTADVMKDDLDHVVAGTDVVISALGLPLSLQTAIDPPPLLIEGALRTTRAMRAAGVRRYIVISASFVAARDRGPIWFRAPAMPTLQRIFAQMGDMERLLRATCDIDWTAVRPGWLLDEPFTGDYTVAEDVIPRNMIRTRHADLAHFMLRCATSDDWIGKTPAIARRQQDALDGGVDLEGLEVDEHSVSVVRYARGLSTFETRWGTFTDPWTHQPQPKCGFVLKGTDGTIE